MTNNLQKELMFLSAWKMRILFSVYNSHNDIAIGACVQHTLERTMIIIKLLSANYKNSYKSSYTNRLTTAGEMATQLNTMALGQMP